MLYCVSYNHGAVGIFSSLEVAKELLFDKYPSITFITQVFKSSDNKSDDNLAWIILYKDNDTYAYVSDNKEEVFNVATIFNKLGKLYEEEIDIMEQEIDVVADCIEAILMSLQNAFGNDISSINETNSSDVASSSTTNYINNAMDNIIYYV